MTYTVVVAVILAVSNALGVNFTVFASYVVIFAFTIDVVVVYGVGISAASALVFDVIAVVVAVD